MGTFERKIHGYKLFVSASSKTKRGLFVSGSAMSFHEVCSLP